MEIKFTAEFIEQRMAAHKKWQHAVECAHIEEIIDECQALPARAPRKSGRLFELLPDPLLPEPAPKRVLGRVQ
jgi:hypothetical protein